MTTISKLRESMGLNQDGLAKALGITQSAVSQIERGETKPRVELALRLVSLAKQYAQVITLEDIYGLTISNDSYYISASNEQQPAQGAIVDAKKESVLHHDQPRQ